MKYKERIQIWKKARDGKSRKVYSSVNNFPGGARCVGGWFYWATGDPRMQFPRSQFLGYRLRSINENLTRRTAERLASNIVDANDMAQFEDAWKWLKIAIFWKKGQRY